MSERSCTHDYPLLILSVRMAYEHALRYEAHLSSDVPRLMPLLTSAHPTIDYNPRGHLSALIGMPTRLASFPPGRLIDIKGYSMKKVAAEPYRDIDLSCAKRGPVVPPEPGKTNICFRLDNRVIDHFRSIVEKSGGGNYQTLINDALVAYIEQQSVLEAVRHVVREEMLGAKSKGGLTGGSTTRGKATRAG